MAFFEIHKLKPLDFRLLIKFNSQIEFVSKSFNSRVECLKLMLFIRKSSSLDETYEVKCLNCGSWYFEFKKPNSQEIIGRSKTYIDKLTVLEKIEQMKLYSPKAKYKGDN